MLGGLMVANAQPAGGNAVVVFGLCLLVGLSFLHPRAAYLRLTAEGFTMCSLFRAQTFRWADISRFGVAKVWLNQMVIFRLAPTATRPARLQAFNVSVFGYDGGVPDTYGLSHEALAALLNQHLAAAFVSAKAG